MIYWYTGQPGHGKSLCAIARAMEFRDQGRIVYVCNVREFDYDKTGMLKMTPEQFRNWMEFLPDGAVALVDEAYEHDMLPKRPPSSKVPLHVERLATHRHKGLDFIFVCQSPDKQVDSFVHDLIERHIHVRRRFGTRYQHLREFDRFERNPEKATPLTIKRQTLPKRAMGVYKSTEMDTIERKIPWYFYAFAVIVPLALFMMYYVFGRMGDRLSKGNAPVAAAHTQGPAANGAQAPVAAGRVEQVKPDDQKALTPTEYISKFVPRVPSQPWSAPLYDGLAAPSEPPRIFCVIGGDLETGSCRCKTEQGTKYVIRDRSGREDVATCRTIAMDGQYEPYYKERGSELLNSRETTEANKQVLAQAQLFADGSNKRGVGQYGTFRGDPPSDDQHFEGHF